jgi:hypothetical protein
MHVANEYFENIHVGRFKYFGATQTDETCLREEIKGRLNLWNACYR